MPRRFPTAPTTRGATASLCRLIVALLQVSIAATAHAAQQAMGKAQTTSRPYLVALGTPALRFQDPAPTPPPAVKPIASGPPVAAHEPEEAEVSLANDQAAASTPPMPLPVAAQSPLPTTGQETDKPGVSAPAPKALPILPDDTRHKVQSQDFLPLFRLPGPMDDSTVIVPAVPTPPAAGTLPPSSATYRVN